MNNRLFNIYVYLSSLSRSLIELFIPLLLYQKGFSINLIIIYFIARYVLSILVLFILNKLINYIRIKNLNYISSIFMLITFIYLKNISVNILDIIIFGTIQTIYLYTYIICKNSYSIALYDEKKSNINDYIIINTIANIKGGIIGAYILDILGFNALIIIVFILSIISSIPLHSIKIDKKITDKISLFKAIKIIPNKTLIVLVLDQFKLVLLSLFPLYIFIYVSDSYKYLGTFNLIVGIMSIVFMYIIKKLNLNKDYYIISCILLVIIFSLKLVTSIKILMLIVGIFEGIVLKLHEKEITHKIYKLGLLFNPSNYIFITEYIFNISRAIIMLISLLFINNLRIIILVCILGIFTSIFFKFDCNIESLKKTE